MDGIRIHKTTAFALIGLAIAIALGGYMVFFAGGTFPPSGQPGNYTLAGNTTATPQDIYIRALRDGTYDKVVISVKRGIPVRLHFTADPDAGCGRQLVVYGMAVEAFSKNGEEDVVEFVPQEEGTYEYSCGMRMWGPGKLVVV